MTGNDNFGYSGHTYRIATDNTEIFIFGRSLESRSRSAYIYAVHEPYVFFCGNSVGQFDVLLVVWFRHCRKTRAKFLVVFASERIFGEQVDMIGNNHNVANLEFLVHASCSVAYEQCLNP